MTKQFLLTSVLILGLAGTARAQTQAAAANAASTFPNVTFGILSYLQYAAELHEMDGYNAFDVTRGYLNINAQLSERLKFRFTPDVRPTTDANLDRNLALRLEYASLEVKTSDNVAVLFGLHENPWIGFEMSVNRYRVIAPMFAERLQLIPGQTDLGASVKGTHGKTEFHVGVYNGEGYGNAELDKYKSIDGRVTLRPFDDGFASRMTISGFYQYGWYARDRPRNVAIVMGTYEQPNLFASAQYLTATDNPFIARDVERRGLSLFGEGREGPTGWAVLGGLDVIDPDGSADGDRQRRLLVGGAHWSQQGSGRLGVVVTLEQLQRATNSQLLSRRLLAQTHVEF